MAEKKSILPLVLVAITASLAYIFLKPFFIDEVSSSLEFIPQEKATSSFSNKKTDKINATIDKQDLAEEQQPIVVNKKLKQAPKVPVPKLNIELHSVFLGKEKNTGYALIAYNGAPQQVYLVGVNLSENVILKSLSAGEIIIDNHGSLEKYQVKETKLADTPVKPARAKKQPVIEPPEVKKDEPPINDFTPPPPYVEPLDAHLSPAQSLETEFIPPPPDDGYRPE